MKNVSDTRGRIIHLLEEALALTDEINDGDTGYAIERALDEPEHKHLNRCRRNEPGKND